MNKYVVVILMLVSGVSFADEPTKAFMDLEVCLPVLRVSVGNVQGSNLLKVRKCTLGELVGFTEGKVQWRKLDDDTWVFINIKPDNSGMSFQFHRVNNLVKVLKTATVLYDPTNGQPFLNPVFPTPYNPAPVIDKLVYGYLNSKGTLSSPQPWNIWDDKE